MCSIHNFEVDIQKNGENKMTRPKKNGLKFVQYFSNMEYNKL